MASKHSGFWAGLGSTLTGVAALVTACLGIVALFYFDRDPGRSEPAVSYVMADQPGINAPDAHSTKNEVKPEPVPVDANQKVSRLNAMAARNDMFVARKAALGVKCNNTRPESYARGELTYEDAEEDLRAERYGVAMDGFRKAGFHYRECGKGSTDRSSAAGYRRSGISSDGSAAAGWLRIAALPA